MQLLQIQYPQKKDICKNMHIHDKKVNVVYLAAEEKYKKISDTKALMVVKEKYRLPDKFVLYVGDVTSNKNLVRLVAAIKKLDIPLVMVGKALLNSDYDKKNLWNKDLITVQHEIKDDKNIQVLGFVSTEDLVAIYNLATLFVMPSLYEGFGLPILEAMQCGTPVVTSHNGSLKEVAGDAAMIVDAYNETNIAEGIEKVFSSQQIQNDLAKKGMLQAKKFSWKKTAIDTIKVYENIDK